MYYSVDLTENRKSHTGILAGTEMINRTDTHVFDQGGEGGVSTTQLSQQCHGAVPGKKSRLDQLV